MLALPTRAVEVLPDLLRQLVPPSSPQQLAGQVAHGDRDDDGVAEPSAERERLLEDGLGRLVVAGEDLGLDVEEVGEPLEVAHLAGELQGCRAERPREHEVPELEVAERRALEHVDEERLSPSPSARLVARSRMSRVVSSITPLITRLTPMKASSVVLPAVGGVGRQGPQLGFRRAVAAAGCPELASALAAAVTLRSASLSRPSARSSEVAWSRSSTPSST